MKKQVKVRKEAELLQEDDNDNGKITTGRKLEIHGTIANAGITVLKKDCLSYRAETKYQRKTYKTN